MWSKKEGDFEYLKQYCKRGLANPDYFHQQNQCLDQAAFAELMAATAGTAEMAGYTNLVYPFLRYLVNLVYRQGSWKLAAVIIFRARSDLLTL